MAVVRNIIDRLVVRLARPDEYESLAVRRYFQRRYNIRVGLYTTGAFDRWRVPPNTVIGRYCSLARSCRLLDGDHPTSALSTHPYFFLRQFGFVDEDRAVIQAPVIEDDVWLGHRCIVTAGCHRIGRGAVIAAGAVVTRDVAPYAVMAGTPAKRIRSRFPDEVIAAIEATQWWTLDRKTLAAALREAPDFALAPSPASAESFLRALGS